MNKLFTALENEKIELMDQQQEIVNDFEIQQLENESNEDIVEVQQMDDVVSTAIESMEELTSIEQVLQTSVDKDTGLQEDAAEIAEVAVEAICARLGYVPIKKIIPSLESFDKVSRLDATKYTLESVKETISQIWEAVKKFFINIWNKLKDFWKYITDINFRLKRKINNIEQRVHNLVRTHAVIKEDNEKIDIEKYCVAFNCKDAHNIMNDLAVTLVAHIDITKQQSFINDNLYEFISLLENNSDIDTIIDKGAKNSHMNYIGVNQKPMIYGKIFNLNNNSFGFLDKKVTVQNSETGVLHINELNKIIKALNNILDNNVYAVKKYDLINKSMSKAISAINKLKRKDFINRPTLHILSRNLQARTSFAFMFNMFVPKYNARAIKLGCDFIDLNIKQYIGTSDASKSTDLVVV